MSVVSEWMIHMVFTTEGFFEVAIESWYEWNLNPRPYIDHWQYIYVYIYIYIYIFGWLNRNYDSSNLFLPVQLQKSSSTDLRSLWFLSYGNLVRVEEFELHHIYNLHSPTNQFYAWSFHISHDQTGGDWEVPIDFV